jgi:hypothetical protein
VLSAHEQISDVEQFLVRTQLKFLLATFEGREIDAALISEMTSALNDEFAFLLEGRRIRVLHEGVGMSVEVAPAIDPEPLQVELAGLEAALAA